MRDTRIMSDFPVVYIKSRRLNEIYTYDEDYERMAGIKRVSP